MNRKTIPKNIYSIIYDSINKEEEVIFSKKINLKNTYFSAILSHQKPVMFFSNIIKNFSGFIKTSMS